MSLRKIMNPKPQKKEEPDIPLPLAGAQPGAGDEQASTIGQPAMIPQDKTEGLKAVLETLPTTGHGGFTLTDMLSMDAESTNLPTILGFPIGAQEKDMYRILERTNFDEYTKNLYTDAIHMAQHGIGWGKPGDPNGLDFTMPQLGEWVVSKMRGAVSVGGHSLEVFEHTTSAWTQALYKQDAERRRLEGRGVQQ